MLIYEQLNYFGVFFMVYYYRYKDTEFTKYPEKYLKYSPQLVKEMIHKLFDQSAGS